MSIRTLVVLLLVGALVAYLMFLAGGAAFVREQVALLFPPELALETNRALHVLLLQETIGLFIVGILIAVTVYFTLSYLVIRPLRKLIQAMEAYMMSGTRLTASSFEEAPKEIQSLGNVFIEFQNRVERARRIDSDSARIKTDFISTAAHQLRTPLTGIRWSLEALEKESLTENQIALIKSAREKSHDLVTIVGTLLDVSAIESGKFQYQFAPMDVRALLEKVTNDFSEMAVRRQVSLFYARSEEELPKARADQERIKWVLNNVIENAIQYTPAGGTVRISADAGGGRIYIRVRDTGIGIPEGDRSNIFERFYRGSNAKSKENKGSGLGLYIARTIAADHGGDLHFAQNENGPGTTFVLSLPTA